MSVTDDLEGDYELLVELEEGWALYEDGFDVVIFQGHLQRGVVMRGDKFLTVFGSTSPVNSGPMPTDIPFFVMEAVLEECG